MGMELAGTIWVGGAGLIVSLANILAVSAQCATPAQNTDVADLRPSWVGSSVYGKTFADVDSRIALTEIMAAESFVAASRCASFGCTSNVAARVRASGICVGFLSAARHEQTRNVRNEIGLRKEHRRPSRLAPVFMGGLRLFHMPPRGARIKALDLSDTVVTERDLRRLKRVPGLKSLSLCGVSVGESVLGDDMLRHIGQLGELRVLSLIATQTTDQGLRHLQNLSNLEELYLFATDVTDTGLEQLRNFKRLRVLTVPCEIGDAGMEQIAPLKELRSLATGYNVTNAGLVHLRGMSHLRSLRLSAANGVTDRGLRHLAQLNALEELDLSYTNVLGTGLRHLKLSRGLWALNLCKTRVSDATVKQLMAFRHLQRLDLSYTRITNVAMDSITRLRHLRQLTLEGTEVTDVGLRKLGQLRDLERLDLSNTRITDAGVDCIARLKNLRAIYLNNCEITDMSLAKLKGLKSLDTLMALGTKITIEGVRDFEKRHGTGCLSPASVELDGTIRRFWKGNLKGSR